MQWCPPRVLPDKRHVGGVTTRYGCRAVRSPFPMTVVYICLLSPLGGAGSVALRLEARRFRYRAFKWHLMPRPRGAGVVARWGCGSAREAPGQKNPRLAVSVMLPSLAS